MKKQFIKNRHGLQVAVVVEEAQNQIGLALVMHGLGGFKEQPHIRVMADAFKDAGYAVVTFDTTNSIGESGGVFEKATITNYYEDLQDVLTWAASQPWYVEPFCLAGHSLGGICTALYAEQHPTKVKAVAPISSVVSGVLSREAHGTEEISSWQKSGWLIKKSKSKPGVTKKLPWSHMEDRLKYDLLPNADKLTMPVLFVVGELDEGTPPGHQQLLFEQLSGQKELKIISGAPHTYRDEKHLKELRSIFGEWIKTI